MALELSDGSTLMHAQNIPYDAVKQHEYYLRTRKLKGRKHATTYSVKDAHGKTVKLSPKQLSDQKAYASHRVAELKKNLNELSAVLRDKLRKANEAKAKSSKPPTLAEKAAAARDAAQYRKKHGQELSNKAKTADSKSSSSGSSSSTSKADTVDSVKKEIATTKANLKAAVAKQRNLATAKKNG